jgi:hypothetical protein
VLARCSADNMSLMAATTLILLDGGHQLVESAAIARLAVAQHRRVTTGRLSSVRNLARKLARLSLKSSRISVMASNILFPFPSFYFVLWASRSRSLSVSLQLLVVWRRKKRAVSCMVLTRLVSAFVDISKR